MGLTDILANARDAMTAQTFGLTVTGQNVANVNTPGYVRRQVVLETRDLGPGNRGGVNAAGILRVADQFIDTKHLSLTGLSAQASTRDQLLGQTEALFNDFVGAGLNSSMSALFSSFSALSANPPCRPAASASPRSRSRSPRSSRESRRWARRST